MDKEELKGWLIGVSVFATFLGFGWYLSAHGDRSVSTGMYSDNDSNHILEDYRSRLNEYDQALNEANDNISDLNNCTSDVFDALDYGSYDDAYSQIQDCQADEVSNPGVDL